jgi:formate-dependent nitrite reductase membrane component NrfD
LGLIQRALNWIIGIAFLLAVLVIFYSGFVLLTANGQPAKRNQALSILKNVIIGLFFISAAWLLVDWIFGLFKVNDEYKLISEIIKKIWIS